MVHVLVAALVVGAGFAAFGRGVSSADSAAASPLSAAAKPEQVPAEAPEADEPGSVQGDVLEMIEDVAEYTYARIGKKGSEGEWVAFPTAEIQLGQHLQITGATKMSDFTSKTLKRTFATIWFGSLGTGGGHKKGASSRMQGLQAQAQNLRIPTAVRTRTPRLQSPTSR